MNLILLKKLEQLSGITADMFNGWVRSGALKEGEHYYKTSKRIFVDTEKLEAWIKSAGAKKHGGRVLKSRGGSPEPLV